MIQKLEKISKQKPCREVGGVRKEQNMEGLTQDLTGYQIYEKLEEKILKELSKMTAKDPSFVPLVNTLMTLHGKLLGDFGRRVDAYGRPRRPS